MKSILIAFLALSCTEPSLSEPRSGTAAAPDGSGAQPRLAMPAGESLSNFEPVSLQAIVAAPERYVDKPIKIHGWAGVCPDLCEGIKFTCDGAPPAAGPCTGYVALAFEKSSRVELQCVARVGSPQSALALSANEQKPGCTGRCGNWNCPGVELGRQHEATGKVRKFLDPSGKPLYTLVVNSVGVLTGADSTKDQQP